MLLIFFFNFLLSFSFFFSITQWNKYTIETTIRIEHNHQWRRLCIWIWVFHIYIYLLCAFDQNKHWIDTVRNMHASTRVCLHALVCGVHQFVFPICACVFACVYFVYQCAFCIDWTTFSIRKSISTADSSAQSSMASRKKNHHNTRVWLCTLSGDWPKL